MIRAPLLCLLAVALLTPLSAAAAGPELGTPYLVRDIDLTGEPTLPECNLSACPPTEPIYGSLLEQLTPFGRRIVLVADDHVHGYEPWISDGTEGGTRMLADVCPGECGSAPLIAGALGDRMLFWASPGTTGSGDRLVDGYSLWETDGTPAGTRSLDGLCPDLCDVALAALGGFEFQGSLFVQLLRNGGVELWRTDGTPGGTAKVLQVCSRGPLCLETAWGFFELEGSLLFSAAGDLWRLDHPSAAPSVVWSGTPEASAALGRSVVLTMGNGLYRMDGPGREPVAILNRVGTHFSLPTAFGGRVYAAAYETYPQNRSRLWRTGGTPGSTAPATGFFDGRIDFAFALEQGLVFVVANRPDQAPTLWVVTPDSGTRKLLDLPVGQIGQAAGRLLFSATDEDHGEELWVTDGTEAGTHRVADLAPGPESSHPGEGGLAHTGFAEAGDRVFFAADRPDLGIGIELWALPVLRPEEPPPPPPGDSWLTSPEVPGFRAQVRISGSGGGAIPGRAEAACLPETLCVSGALPGRSEVFVRVVGPKPNGFLWPTLVKFSTSTVEVWIEQPATGEIRYYRLEGARPGHDELPGLFDRHGFEP